MMPYIMYLSLLQLFSCDIDDGQHTVGRLVEENVPVRQLPDTLDIDRHFAIQWPGPADSLIVLTSNALSAGLKLTESEAVALTKAGKTLSAQHTEPVTYAVGEDVDALTGTAELSYSIHIVIKDNLIMLDVTNAELSGKKYADQRCWISCESLAQIQSGESETMAIHRRIMWEQLCQRSIRRLDDWGNFLLNRLVDQSPPPKGTKLTTSSQN